MRTHPHGFRHSVGLLDILDAPLNVDQREDLGDARHRQPLRDQATLFEAPREVLDRHVPTVRHRISSMSGGKYQAKVQFV